MKKQLLLLFNNNITSKLLCPHDYHEQLALMHALSYALSTRSKAKKDHLKCCSTYCTWLSHSRNKKYLGPTFLGKEGSFRNGQCRSRQVKPRLTRLALDKKEDRTEESKEEKETVFPRQGRLTEGGEEGRGEVRRRKGNEHRKKEEEEEAGKCSGGLVRGELLQEKKPLLPC